MSGAVPVDEAKQMTVAGSQLSHHSPLAPIISLREAREAAEREVIQKALQKHSGKIVAAAAELGISRPTLYELMEKLSIVRPERKGNKAE